MSIKYNLIEQVINEGRLEDVIKKYAETIDEGSVRYFSQNDPSGNNKYLEWMVKSFIAMDQGNAGDIVEMVKCFHTNLNRLNDNHITKIYGEENFQNPSEEQKRELERIKKTPKDINSYASHLWIKPMCEYFEELKPATTDRVKIWENDRWILVSPLTHAASCKYGIHSNWCVSTANSDYYKRYSKDGPLIFWLDKKEKHPTRGETIGNYKIAVHIKYEYADRPQNWAWFSMEDHSLESTFMLTVLPKAGLDACAKYTEELSVKKGASTKEYMEKLSPYILGYGINGKYAQAMPIIDENGKVPQEVVDFFKTEQRENHYRNIEYYFNNYAEQGRIPYLTFDFNYMNEYGKPDIGVDSISTDLASRLKDPKGVIKKSAVLNELNQYEFFMNLSPENKTKILDLYVNSFNKKAIKPNEQVPSSRLVVGDTIMYKEQGRRWGRGDEVTVVRATDKSLVLSNGKRITKTNTNYKVKLFPQLRIVDDLNESIWIRKRII